jgi:hypothetical protein
MGKDLIVSISGNEYLVATKRKARIIVPPKNEKKDAGRGFPKPLAKRLFIPP